MREIPAGSSAAVTPGAPLSPFSCSWRADSLGAGWVQAAGELDLVGSPHLRLTLREAREATGLVVLDLRGVSFIDSSGIHVILDVAGSARRDGGWLLVVRGAAQVNRLLMLTEASKQVLIFDAAPDEPASAPLRVPASEPAA